MPPTKRKSAAGNAANQGTSSKAKPAGKAKPVTGKAATGKAKPAAKDKPAAAAEATVGKDGYTTWSLPDGVVHYKCSGEPARDSIAAFSLDDTITVVKSGARQQLDADDWAFFGEDVPGVLRVRCFRCRIDRRSTLQHRGGGMSTGPVQCQLNMCKSSFLGARCSLHLSNATRSTLS